MYGRSTTNGHSEICDKDAQEQVMPKDDDYNDAQEQGMPKDDDYNDDDAQEQGMPRGDKSSVSRLPPS